jgi:hypothetical protein
MYLGEFVCVFVCVCMVCVCVRVCERESVCVSCHMSYLGGAGQGERGLEGLCSAHHTHVLLSD